MIVALVALALATSPYDALLGTTVTTAADEYAIGAEYVETSLWLAGRWKNDAQETRVETMTRRIVATSDRPVLIVNVVLLDDPEVNAAALPGGFLLVNRGLLELLDDDQLAFVIGHELSHVILRHGASTMNIKAASSAVVQLQTSRVSADRAAAEARVEDLYLMMASHSRQLELEADLYGLVYTIRAGYPSSASMAALTAVDAAVGGEVPEERRPWMSHPLTVERVEQLRRGYQGIEQVHAQFEDGVAWADVGRYDQAIACFQQFLTLFPHSPAAWTNLGAVYLHQVPVSAGGWVDVLPMHAASGVHVRGDTALARDRARDALAHALQIDGGDPTALTLAGVLARREGRLAEAQALLDRALIAAPGSAATLTDLGNVAADAGRPADAIVRWTAAQGADPAQVEAQVNLARLYAADPKARKKAIAAWGALVDHPRWGAEAKRAREALGVRPEGPAGGGAGGVEVFTLRGKTLAPGIALAEAVAVLGPTDPADPAQLGGFSMVRWDALDLRGIVGHENVAGWLVGGDSTATLRDGVGLGATEAAVIAGWGVPDQRTELGSITLMRWTDRGVVMRLEDGRVCEFSLQVPGM